MAASRKQSFLHGALILSAATALVKIIGALFKIPLAQLFEEGSGGMTYFTVAYNVYATLFTVSTAGLPIAVSKMVSAALAQHRNGDVKRIFRVSLLSFVVIGLSGGVSLYIFAPDVARWMNAPGAAAAIQAIAPAVFFVSVIAALRGYHQGHGNMIPTALSQVIEASGKLVMGFGLAYWLLRQGQPVPIVAAGAIGGVAIGSSCGMVYMLLYPRPRHEQPQGALSPRRARPVLEELLRLSIPITISSSVLSMTNLLDTSLVLGRLQQTLGIGTDAANAMYDPYTYAQTIFNLPQAFIVTLAVSVIPSLSAAQSRHDFSAVTHTVQSALRLTALLSLPAACGLITLGMPIIDLLYGSRHPGSVASGGQLLSTLGVAVLFVCLVSLTNSMLQALGHVLVPVMTMVVGGACKLICNYVLVGMPEINIMGAPVGTVVCYLVITLLNFIVLLRKVKCPGLWRLLGKPLLASAGMSAVAYAVWITLSRSVGSHLALIAGICAGALVYGVLILLLRGLTKSDVLMLPKGDKIASLLRLS